ncbi:hypothetical protein [Bradyrhizobium erythrophlei]|uniref:Uncharacterized protein n=1 Tax=Bradyrhizobium erythrophlei TaxID=1437360 RepID=A0A1M7UY38_9BRAD|nr:hypothetical protein [Bradyrhizobium erythrophlei]SHN87874.1 hypothetical protein SAMN05444170_7420 [Bradyrhizobium erythrophlei]
MAFSAALRAGSCLQVFGRRKRLAVSIMPAARYRLPLPHTHLLVPFVLSDAGVHKRTPPELLRQSQLFDGVDFVEQSDNVARRARRLAAPGNPVSNQPLGAMRIADIPGLAQHLADRRKQTLRKRLTMLQALLDLAAPDRRMPAKAPADRLVNAVAPKTMKRPQI